MVSYLLRTGGGVCRSQSLDRNVLQEPEMSVLINILIVLGTFVMMEGVAWVAHKHVMHGFMWWAHHDHHNHTPGFFEKNDLFFLIFAIPSAYFFYAGSLNADFRLWIGMGILLYGMGYVFVHDIFIHQRFKWLRRTDNLYFTAIRKAHLVHHKHLGPEDGECFGMLWAPPKYFAEARKSLAAKRGTDLHRSTSA